MLLIIIQRESGQLIDFFINDYNHQSVLTSHATNLIAKKIKGLVSNAFSIDDIRILQLKLNNDNTITINDTPAITDNDIKNQFNMLNDINNYHERYYE